MLMCRTFLKVATAISTAAEANSALRLGFTSFYPQGHLLDPQYRLAFLL
jgi:hypothetical protein